MRVPPRCECGNSLTFVRGAYRCFYPSCPRYWKNQGGVERRQVPPASGAEPMPLVVKKR